MTGFLPFCVAKGAVLCYDEYSENLNAAGSSEAERLMTLDPSRTSLLSQATARSPTAQRRLIRGGALLCGRLTGTITAAFRLSDNNQSDFTQ